MKDEYLAELARLEMRHERRLASMRFFDSYGRAPSSEDELSQFTAQEKTREAEKRRRQAVEEKERDALILANAKQYDQWLEKCFSKLIKVLEHQKPDQTVALRKFTANDQYLKKLEAAGGLSLGLPVSEPDLTGQAKAAFSTLCQGLVCQSPRGDIIGELKEHLDWKPKSYFVSLPHAEFLEEEGIPCLLFVAEPCGIIVIEISKTPSFQKNIWLYSVKDKNGHEEKVDERSFTFKATAPYLLGYYWTDLIPLDWSTESLLVPTILLDALARGLIEDEGVKVKARLGYRTSYNVKGCDEMIEISDGFAGFLRRLKPPWYQDMARLDIIDNKTSEIVQLKLAQSTSPSIVSQQGWSDDDFIACLTSPALGFSAAAAKEKLKILKGKNIDRNITLDEAIRMALKG